MSEEDRIAAAQVQTFYQALPEGRAEADELLRLFKAAELEATVNAASSGAYHGYLMLLNLDGDDSKFSCELLHGHYSWVGPAVRVFACISVRPGCS